jgi:hypothetical protein
MPKNAIRSDSPTPIRSQPGCRVPSKREIAAKYGISRASVRESITELLNSGLLFRTVGRGRFVSAHRQESRRDPAASSGANIAFIISENIFNFVPTGYNRVLGGVQEISAAEGWTLQFHTVGDDANNPALLAVKNHAEPPLGGCVVVGEVPRHVIDLLHDRNVSTIPVDLLISDVARVEFKVRGTTGPLAAPGATSPSRRTNGNTALVLDRK